MGVYQKKFEGIYMEEQKEMNQTQRPPWLVNNILFCYEGEIYMGSDSERKQHFLQYKEKLVITKKPTQTIQKVREGR